MREGDGMRELVPGNKCSGGGGRDRIGSAFERWGHDGKPSRHFTQENASQVSGVISASKTTPRKQKLCHVVKAPYVNWPRYQAYPLPRS